MNGDRPGARSGSRRVGVRRELFVLYGVAALALLLVSVGAVLASQVVARSQALKDAERTTTRLANLVIGPLLVPVLEGHPDRAAALDQAVVNRMGDGDLIEINVWDSDGTIVYANEAKEIGERFDPPVEVTAAIENGAVSSAFADHPEADEMIEGHEAGFVEVYVPFQLPDGRDLAFEAYYDYARVEDVANSLLMYLIPLVLIPLLVMQLIEIPIAASLARRVRRHEAERGDLLELTLSVSERERIAIAADLHDGPIQDLAGVGFALDAIAPTVPSEQAWLMQNVQDTVGHAIESLRWLIVDLYPPDLSGPQLPHTIETLAAPLRTKGVDVSVDVEALPEMNRDVLTTLYRVTREALANVAEHASADQVDISVGAGIDERRPGKRTVQLTITDNGVGIDQSAADRRAQGHIGLLLLKDRVESLGGTWTTGPAAGGGTAITAVLPLVDAPDRAWTAAADQISPSPFTASRSSANSATEASILPRE